MSERIEDSGFGKKAAGPVDWLDSRLGLATVSKKNLRKVFPDHWSFMLGEIALWSFVVLLISGVFLTLWFQPSMGETVYQGSYAPLRGQEMSLAYASTLDISFDIRGGLLVRQIHHWAAALFIAAMMVHMLRVFFTGAYRKPREINWIIGVLLLLIGTFEGFAGYSLPDDLLSGTGLRIMNGIIRSTPIIGSYIEFFLFGGEFPGELIIPRLYMAHILLLPALLLGLIAAHMLLLVYHKHTQWPGPGRTENNVVGYPMLPVYAAKAGGFFFIVFGFTVLMSALFEMNAVWIYGPYNPAEVTAGSQPDFYLGFTEGATRIFPSWEPEFLGFTWSLSIFVPANIALGGVFGALLIWPFIEAWIRGDSEEHHLLERPRNAPTRTGLGVAGIIFYGVLWAAGGNDIMALKLGLDIFGLTWAFRILVIAGPIIGFIVTRRICIGLQRQDEAKLLHGYETGIIERTAQGGYSERHNPLPLGERYALTARRPVPELTETPAEDANGVAAPRKRRNRLRNAVRRFYYYGEIDKPSREEIEHAEEHFGDHDGGHPIDEGREDFEGISETGVPRQH